MKSVQLQLRPPDSSRTMLNEVFGKGFKHESVEAQPVALRAM